MGMDGMGHHWVFVRQEDSRDRESIQIQNPFSLYSGVQSPDEVQHVWWLTTCSLACSRLTVAGIVLVILNRYGGILINRIVHGMMAARLNMPHLRDRYTDGIYGL